MLILKFDWVSMIRLILVFVKLYKDVEISRATITRTGTENLNSKPVERKNGMKQTNQT